MAPRVRTRSGQGALALAAGLACLRGLSLTYVLPPDAQVQQVSRRPLLFLSAAPVLTATSAATAKGFDPFGTQLREEELANAPKDLNNPPPDAVVTASGLKFRKLQALPSGGQCQRPRPFDQVEVDYTGYEMNGHVFDSSAGRGGSVRFKVHQVIRGWTEGLQSMCPGEVFRFWIPSALAFGAEGKGGPRGDLCLDVKLNSIARGVTPRPTPADVTGPPADAEVTKTGLATKVLEAGTGTKTARDATKVTVEYTGWTTTGELFESNIIRRGKDEPATFKQQEVPKGWWEGVQLMTVNETRRLWVPSKLAYGDRRTDGGPSGLLTFDVKLIDFSESWF
eukprot:TRINITY_DN47110_c0_g1_i1.p2 TRINITY_DN47110_c0_g1~~TRINITY_DN47110_c0_g1_i1.p2  ORF type:complete len:344 (+),score=55.14 TRINITY_DN47110_c0_g1_i1:24-1034(+)